MFKNLLALTIAIAVMPTAAFASGSYNSDMDPTAFAFTVSDNSKVMISLTTRKDSKCGDELYAEIDLQLDSGARKGQWISIDACWHFSGDNAYINPNISGTETMKVHRDKFMLVDEGLEAARSRK